MKRRNKFLILFIFSSLALIYFLHKKPRPTQSQVVIALPTEIKHSPHQCKDHKHSHRIVEKDKPKDPLIIKLNEKYEKEKKLILTKYQRRLTEERGYKVEVDIIKESVKQLQMQVKINSERHGQNGFIAVVDKETGRIIMTHSKTTHENPKYRENLRLKL